jgi:dynein intermediate chain 2
VLLVKRKAKGPNDRVGAVYPGHHGPIYALARHSMFSKVFITVGDWTARIWNDEIRSPIMTTKYHASYLTDGCWSPTRPGVFFTTKMDGTVDIWDYFFKQGEPTLTLQVTDMPLHCLRCEEKGCLLATGAAESKREKNLDVRQKEAKLAAKKAEALAVQAAKGADGAEKEEQRLLEVEREFFEIISATAEHKTRSGSDSF